MYFSLTWSLLSLTGCGPSRDDLAVLVHTLEEDPAETADLAFTNALTTLPEPPTEGTCTAVLVPDPETEQADLAAWATANPEKAGRRGGRPRWTPLQAGRVTIARTPGRAAALGSASHRIRWAKMQALPKTPGFDAQPFHERLSAAQALAEGAMEPELVLVLPDETHLEAWVFDVTAGRMSCGGRLELPAGPESELLARWRAEAPRTPPDAASVDALVKLGTSILHPIVRVEAAKTEAPSAEAAVVGTMAAPAEDAAAGADAEAREAAGSASGARGVPGTADGAGGSASVSAGGAAGAEPSGGSTP